MNPAGEKLNPNHHEAIAEVPDANKDAGTVAQVFKDGYAISVTKTLSQHVYHHTRSASCCSCEVTRQGRFLVFGSLHLFLIKPKLSFVTRVWCLLRGS
jgi:hypothetical protein